MEQQPNLKKMVPIGVAATLNIVAVLIFDVVIAVVVVVVNPSEWHGTTTKLF